MDELQDLTVKNAQESEQNKGESWVSKLRYTKSFLAKICLSNKWIKEAYCTLFNALASYEGVAIKTAFSCVTFSYKRKPLAIVTLVGKTLNVYFAIEPSVHATGRYRLMDVSTKKRFSRVPARYRIKSDGGLRFALKLIEEVAAAFSLQKRQEVLPPVTVKNFPTRSIRELISRGLIRTMGGDRRAVRVSKEIPLYIEKEADKETSQNDVYSDTVSVGNQLVERHEEYEDILNSFSGEGDLRFLRQKIVRPVDESWVKAIEDCLPSLDEVTRNPSHFIEETEELLPIERTKKVTTRSIRHLSQHTGLISRIEGDVVIPSKLLNVFRDESVMTYENKFVNTLLSRLFDFVTTRFEEAEEFGANRRKSIFSYTDVIRQGEERGKFTIELEVSVPTEEKEKNTFFQSDLWARVKKLHSVISDYRGSEFAGMMGNAVVRPPVVRTNPILKNKDLRQCLELWEFLEGYDDEAAGVATSETEIDVSEPQMKFVMQSAAQQYLLFRRFAGLAEVAIAENEDHKEKKRKKKKAYEEYKPNLSVNEKEEVTADLSNPNEEETAFWVDVALQAEEIALTEWKEEQAKLLEERARLLAEAEKEREERERAERESIRSTVDTIPAEYPAYAPPTFEEAEEQTPVTEEQTPAAEETSEEEGDETLREEDGEIVVYVKSFAAKLRLADEELKGYYCAIANALLRKAGVRERSAFDHVDFYKGRRTIARIMIAGKTLRVYFAPVSEEMASKYGLAEKSEVKKFAATPYLLKVKGPRGLKKALDLVEELTDSAVAKNPTVKQKEEFQPMSTEDAILAGEVRRRVISAWQRERLNRIRRRVEEKQPYDYTEEVAAYQEKEGKKKVKSKELVLDPSVSPAAIGKKLEKTEMEEIASIPEEQKPALEGAGGDPLFARAEAVPESVSLEEPKKQQAEPEVKKPIEVPPDGDVLRSKPITLDALLGNAPAPQKAEEFYLAPEEPKAPEKKKGFLSRLFGRKDK